MIAVVIPVWNEAESIGVVVREIPRHLASRVIVVDGGSTDRTVEIAREAGAEVIVAGTGYGRACLMGAEAASDAEIVVFMDGDGADDARRLADLVDPIRTGSFDFVIASRLRGKRQPGAMAWHQVLAGRAAGWVMSRLYGTRYTDMCAFRAIRRDALFSLGLREMTYGWNLEMQMRAAQSRLRILEIPVDARRRIGGASKVAGTVSGTIHAACRILATLARVAAERGVRPVSSRPAIRKHHA
jgi:glycosyltransferase involved in cell wall biosynthesis